MSLEDELRQHFKSEQPSVPSEGLGPEAIMRIGQERRRSSRIRSTAAGFVVVSAAVLAVLALPNIGADRTIDPADIVAGPDSTLAPELAGPTDGPTVTPIESRTVESAGRTWTISEPTLGWARRIVADDTGFYALSTAPGTTWEDADEANLFRIPEAIYSSTDGINWDVRELPAEQYAADFGASNGVLYLLGTAPATADPHGPVDVWLDTSTDRGKSWSRQTMRMADITTPAGLGDYLWANTSASLAVMDGTALAAVSTNYWIDVYRLAPSEYRNGDFDIRQTETGLEVFDMSATRSLERACEDAWYHYELDTPPEDRGDNFTPDACKDLEAAWENPEDVVYSATWAELGIADIGPLSYSALFISADGAAPVEFDSPFDTSTQSLQLSASAAGFTASAWGPDPSATEGWGSSVWTSTDGRDWVKAPSLTEAYETSPIGSFNGQIIATTYASDGTGLAVLENGSWRTLDVYAGLGPVPTGSERWILLGGAGGDGVWLVAQTSSYPDSEVQPTESSYYEGAITDTDLVFSEDLVSWTLVDLNDLLGPDAPTVDLWVNQMSVSASTVYLTVNGYNPETNETYAAAIVGRK